MKRFFMLVLLTTFVITTVMSSGASVFAKSTESVNKKINELDKEQGDLQHKENKVQNNKKNVKDKMGKNEEEQSTVEKQMEAIESKLSTTEEDIKSKESEITATNNEIDDLHSEIEQLGKDIVELMDRIKKREELLKDRLRSIQEVGGNVKYVSVILGSENFSDLISRSSAVNTIMDSDKSIMEEHEADKRALEQKQEELETKKSEVEEKKVALESQKDKLQSLKDKLDSQRAEKERLKAQLVVEYEELEEYNLTLEEEEQLIAAEAAVVKEAKELAVKEKSEIEKAERERIAKEKAAAKENKPKSQSGGSSPNVQASTTVNSSGYIRPTSGRISSEYGYRFHPIHKVNRLHAGIDIAAGSGTAVNAAASGKVAYAGWMNGYGNTVTVSHGSVTTLYAHLSSISVSAGQTVNQGQNLGAVGSTGNSTGPHLHFEVHPNGYGNGTANPRNYVNF